MLPIPRLLFCLRVSSRWLRTNSTLMISISLATSKCQLRFAPTHDRFPSGTVIGLPPERLIAFSGIVT
jgi:hypothetical protein